MLARYGLGSSCDGGNVMQGAPVVQACCSVAVWLLLKHTSVATGCIASRDRGRRLHCCSILSIPDRYSTTIAGAQTCSLTNAWLQITHIQPVVGPFTLRHTSTCVKGSGATWVPLPSNVIDRDTTAIACCPRVAHTPRICERLGWLQAYECESQSTRYGIQPDI